MLHEKLVAADFTVATWQANEALIIEFAYRVTERGCVLLGQGDEEGNDPFNAPSDERRPIHFCFVPAKHAEYYEHFASEDGLGRAYTEAYAEDNGTELFAPHIDGAILSANLLLD